MTAAELTAIKERSRIKGEQLAQRAIGEPFKVRIDKNATVTGVIVECELKKVYIDGRKIRGQYRVVMECGSAKARQQFFVSAIP